MWHFHKYRETAQIKVYFKFFERLSVPALRRIIWINIAAADGIALTVIRSWNPDLILVSARH